MTGLELVALAVGSTAGMALSIRSLRGEAAKRAAQGTRKSEPLPELVKRGEDDMIVGVFERLASEEAVGAAVLGRARLLHDVASSAGSLAERSAAGRQLVAMFKEWDTEGMALEAWSAVGTERCDTTPKAETHEAETSGPESGLDDAWKH